MIPQFGWDEVAQITAVLTEGRTVALPTDTVYGVAALVARPRAVAALFELKQRPASLALPLLIGSWEQLRHLGIVATSRERAVATALWPGALTIVFDAPSALAHMVGSTDPTVGVRWPRDAALEELLVRAGPLAVTSANQHGSPPCHDAEDVQRAFADSTLLGAVVDGGRRAGTPSTVVRVTPTSFTVLRAGAVTDDQLSAALNVATDTVGEQGDH